MHYNLIIIKRIRNYKYSIINVKPTLTNIITEIKCGLEESKLVEQI